MLEDATLRKGRQERNSPVTPRGQEIARLLHGMEAVNKPAQSPDAEVRFRVLDRLRLPLSSFTGTKGFQALIYRALTLTKAEIPRFEPVQLGHHGCLEHLSDIEPRLSAEEAALGEVILIGNMVDLLCNFLGEALALRLIKNAWPEASFDEVADRKGTKA